MGLIASVVGVNKKIDNYFNYNKLIIKNKIHKMRKISKYIEAIKGYIEFRVGQNAKENFDLIDISSPNDLWFHISQQASCHVVATIPQDGRFAEPPGGAKRRFSIDSPLGLSTDNDTLDKRILKKIAVQGAVICKQCSRHKSESAICVMYTPIKNVKKGGNMGSVFVDEYKTLVI